MATNNALNNNLSQCTLLNLTTGVTGNLDVSHFDSGTNASASTYWSGGMAWLDPTQGGATLVNIQYFTSGTGTYTATSGTGAIIVDCIGAGGGGGGAAATGAGQCSAGAGGGGGGFVRKYYATVPSPCSYSVGAGGSGGIGASNGSSGGPTEFNSSDMKVLGGAGGGFGAASSSIVCVNPGNGGVADGIDNSNLKFPGCCGEIGMSNGAGNAPFAGNGGAGAGIAGSGGMGPIATTSNGNNGAGYGGGGSGACNLASQSASNGGNGSSGCIIVWEYA